MRTLDRGRLVVTRVDSDELPAGALCRVVDPFTPTKEVLVQAALGTVAVTGGLFAGHDGGGGRLLRTRGWFISRDKLAPLRVKVASAREFRTLFGVRGDV